MIRKFLLFVLFVFAWYGGFSQDFKLKALLDSVPNNGFYRILLSPEIIASSLPDYADIRLYDARKKEVPFIFEEEQTSTSKSAFKEYPILENQNIARKGITRIVVHNKSKEIVSGLSLIVRNSEIQKEITVKGSDDQKNWYIIQRNFPIRSVSYNETAILMELEFTKSDYEFFELTMNDKKKDPIQVTKVGFYDLETSKGLYSEIPSSSTVRKDSASIKKSFITLKFSQAFEISKLEISVTGPEFFLRDCYIGKNVRYKKNVQFEEWGHFRLSSGNVPIWEFDKIKTDELTIIIENADNLPLTVKSIKAYQLNKYLVAGLKAGETYEIATGKEKMLLPDYDLKFFADSLPANLPVLKANKLIRKTVVPTSGKVFFTQTVLWVVIGLVILLLAFFSVKVVKEMKDAQKSEKQE